jgi:2-phospho-L-lactate guanylyltransferase
VLITRRADAAHAPAFGGESRAAHRRAGYVELAIAADSGLRRDVDTAQQLAALSAAGRLGARSAALVGVAAQRVPS